MIFPATEQEIQTIIANAVNAAKPFGMGFIHYQQREYKPEEFNLSGGRIELDYHDGRMVKLGIRQVSKLDSTWEVHRGQDVHPEYQSWAYKYPTIEALINSGI